MKNGRKIKDVMYVLALMGGLIWGLSAEAEKCCPPDSPDVKGCDNPDCELHIQGGEDDCGKCEDIDSTYCNCKDLSINYLSWNGNTPVCTGYQHNILKENCPGEADGKCPCCVICNSDSDCTSDKGGPRCAYAGSVLAECRCNDHSDCSDPNCRCEDTGAGVKRCRSCPISGQTCCGGECCPSGWCYDV